MAGMDSATLTRTNRAAFVAGQQCPLCGERGYPTGTRKDGIELRECRAGHEPVLLAWAGGTAEEYERLYRSEYHDAEMERTGRLDFFRRDTEYLQTAASRLRLLREFYPTARTLLDVGCGNGATVAQAALFGFDAQGIEPSGKMAHQANLLGRCVLTGTWKDADGLWDLILLCDVLEHLTDPVGCLIHLKSLIQPFGSLIVEMPEYLAPDGCWERHNKPHEHPFLLTEGAARRLFSCARLRVENCWRPRGGALAKFCFSLKPE